MVKLPSSSVVTDEGMVSTSLPSKVMVIDRSSLNPVPVTVTLVSVGPESGAMVIDCSIDNLVESSLILSSAVTS